MLGLFTVLLLLLLSAACSSPEPAQPPKLTIFGMGLEAGEQLRQDALTDFMRQTGVDVDMMPTAGTSAEQVKLARILLENRLGTPDIYVIDIIWLQALREHLLDLSPYIDLSQNEHMPAMVQKGQIDGQIVAIPFYVNAGVLYYRADLLEQYGYSGPPKTWDELDRMALRIQRSERTKGKSKFWGYVWQGAAYEGLTCNAIEWVASFGGGRVIEDNGRISINNPQAVRALDMAKARIGTISPASVLSYTESDTLNVFQGSGALFLRHWSSAYPRITRLMPPFSTKVALLPGGPSGQFHSLGGFYLAVSRYSKHKQKAAQLVNYLASTEIQRRRATLRGYLPTSTALHQDSEFAKSLPPFQMLRNVAPERWIARFSHATGEKYAESSQLFYETVHRILSRQAETAPALAQLERDLTLLMKAPASN